MNKKETYNTPDQNDARQRKIKRIYLVTATTAALAFTMAMPAFAANDPLATINSLSDFVFSAIKAIGAILWAASRRLWSHCPVRCSLPLKMSAS